MGWGHAWRVALWARLLDGEKAYSFVEYLLTKWTESNMFDKPSVQLDGNFGATAGIAEMLLQSHTGEIHLLSALPKTWPMRFVKGLRARGGFEVDIAWKDGTLTEATIRSINGTNADVRYGSQTINIELKRGGAIQMNDELKP
jgi:alpha-L-fucosidase 2